MRIVFNSLCSGLGNNGGSRTILLSAEAFRALGHTCEVAATVDLFTWFPHKKPISYLPEDFDLVINVAAVDYISTRECRIPNKVAWWRGHEIWTNDENSLKLFYNDDKVHNVVNSEGLQQLLRFFGASSSVIYQGFDLTFWKDLQLRKGKITIGSLYNNKPTKRWEDFLKLIEILPRDSYRFVAFGATTPPNVRQLDLFIEKPSREALRELYSSTHIWFSSTVSEGLHNVPAEANLCGALVLCNDNKNNGMLLDYAFPNKTAMVYKTGVIDEAVQCIKKADFSLVPKMQEVLHKKIGSREDNMRKFLDLL